MKKYKCPICKETSCGEDAHTITKYVGPEIAVGDRMKVCLLQIYDMISYDNLQKSEIRALLNNLIDEHVEEE